MRRAALLAALLGLVLPACGADEPPDVEAAVLRVSLASCQLNVENRATAVAIGGGLALTVAHSFDQADDVTLITADGSEWAAELVYLDRERDIALLSFASGTQGEPTVATLEVRSDDDEPADEARIVVHRDDATAVQSVQLLRRIAVTLDGEGRRNGIELGGVIEKGDSGAPVIDTSGRIIGLVFASSRGSETGWAIAGSELLDIASKAGAPIDLACATGAGS